MRRAAILFTIGAALSAGDARADRGGALRPLRDVLREVLDDARDENPECRRAVVGGLQELRDRLDEIDGRRRKLKVALRALRDVQASAEDDCPRSIRKGLRRALDVLADAADDARDDGDDDRRDRDRSRDRDRDDRPRRRVECWNPEDPGCFNTKGGNSPMGRAAFEGVRAAVSAAGPNVFGRLDAIRIGVSNGYLTSMQMVLLVRMLKPSVFQMLDAVKACAPRLVDPQNGQGVAAEFGPSVFQARDAAAAVAAEHGDP